MPLFGRSDDKDRIAFTVKERLESGNWQITQGIFDTKGEHRVYQGSDRTDSVFVCYRRQDTHWAAASVRSELVQHLGAPRVFMDTSDIEPGADFVEAIYAALTRCQVVLVMIGPRWLDPAAPGGNPRIADPQDYVRLELETAVALKRRIVPILVDGARMPTAEQLPISLTGISRRQAIAVTPGDFRQVVHRLVRVVDGAT
ncbi:toll/interleukin-1 receptor domain-containing protein [Paractinoplanes toevensis]|uniref:toll/interleukin-1 receptor domain-containing protein n=1 Tax=Paractinoplanes toevensis TaxID=571911 RepID=UPI001BB386B5|nr:toll/interleukin-1 receptor domain-containing protein [Actinoplanes toevensis]